VADGLGFFGNALEAGAYYVEDPTLGPLCFLCARPAAPRTAERLVESAGGEAGDAAAAAARVTIVPRDAFGRAAFLEPLALWLEAQAGTLAQLVLCKASRTITVTFAAPPAEGASYDVLRLALTKTSKARPGADFKVEGAALVRGAYEIVPDPQGGETSASISYAAAAAAISE
jgi:hypothetical protein